MKRFVFFSILLVVAPTTLYGLELVQVEDVTMQILSGSASTEDIMHDIEIPVDSELANGEQKSVMGDSINVDESLVPSDTLYDDGVPVAGAYAEDLTEQSGVSGYAESMESGVSAEISTQLSDSHDAVVNESTGSLENTQSAVEEMTQGGGNNITPRGGGRGGSGDASGGSSGSTGGSGAPPPGRRR